MSTTTTLDALHQRVLRTLWPNKGTLIETTSGAGSTTSLVLAALINTSQSANAYDGVGVYCPSVTASPKESCVTRGGFTAASGTFTMSPPYGSSPGTSAAAYFLYGLTMDEIDEAINQVVRTLYLPRYSVLTLIDDGDMESSAITSWPDFTGTPTQTKETSIVLTGTQSLKLVIATVDNSVRSLSLPVTEGDSLYFSSAIKCTAGSLRAQLYDVTNSAEIQGVTVDEEDWTDVRFQASVPNNCQNVQVRYIGKTTDTTAYVDYAAVYSTRSVYNVTMDVNDIFGIAALPSGMASEAGSSYMGLSGVMRAWPHYRLLADYAGVNSHRIEIQQACLDPLFLHYRAPDAILAQNTSDTDTTFVPVNVLVAGAVAECHQRLGNAREAAHWTREYQSQLRTLGIDKTLTVSPQRRVYA